MRIALATVGTAGDVRPFAVLADALVAAGHDVTAVTWPVHRQTLERPGVRVETAGPHEDPAAIDAAAEAAAAVPNPLAQVAVLRDFHLASGEEHLIRLRELLAGHDLVVLHGIHTLAHAAVLDLAAPWASVVFDPVLLPTRTTPPPGMPPLGPLNRVAWSLLERALARTARPLGGLLERAGSRQRTLPLFRARSPTLHLVACSPALIAVPRDLPPTTHVSGAWADRSAPPSLPAEIDAFLARGAAPVVVTFGSMRGVPDVEIDAALGALNAGGLRVIVQRGRRSAPSEATSALEIGEVDHRALFPRSSLVVHHGGAGTTHAVARAGVPSVVVPQVGDQRYWAARLQRLRVAGPPVAVHGITGERVRAAIQGTVADAGMRAAARDLAARMAPEDGVATAVRLLETARRS